jgi:hypothetical protein
MAATRLRKTFQYPTESDDEDAVEQGMDEQGTFSPLEKKAHFSLLQLTPTARSRSPHLHPLRARHIHDTHLHAPPQRTPPRPRSPAHPSAHRHLYRHTESRSDSKFPRKRVHAVLPPAGAAENQHSE